MLIRGPVSLSVLEFRGTIWYFFGDHHYSLSSDCPEEQSITINEVLDRMLDFNDLNEIKTDVYVEENFIKDAVRTKGKEDDWLGRVRVQLYQCLDPLRNRCKYTKRIRFHYTDVRTSIIGDKAAHSSIFIIPLYYYMTATDKLQEMNESVQEMQSNLDKILDYLLDTYTISKHLIDNAMYYFDIETKSNNYTHDVHRYKINERLPAKRLHGAHLRTLAPALQNDLGNLTKSTVIDIDNHTDYSLVGNELYELSKINTDWSGLVYEYFKGKVLDIKDKFSTQDEAYIGRLKTLNKMRNGDPQLLFSSIIEAYENYEASGVLKIASYLMDIYAVSRMLRFADTQEIISYSGDAHNKSYIDFFTNVFDAVLIEEADVLGERCIASEALDQKLN